jgi:sucrose phosphorylase
VGLLAGENDMHLLAKSGVGRDINRHSYTLEEIDLALKRPVVQSLFELIRFRNQHPAFQGTFSMPGTPDSTIILRWDSGNDWVMLEVDFISGSYSIFSSPTEITPMDIKANG